MRCKKIIAVAFAIGLISNVNAQKDMIVVKANQPVAKIEPTMWGIFFEDINMGADGGIYAEMVKNRSFEFYKPLMGWTVKQSKFNEGSVLVVNRQDADAANPRFIRITKNVSTDSLSLTNEGFRGMGIKKGLRYDFSVMYRQQSTGITLKIELLNSAGTNIGGTSLTPSATSNDWQKQAISFNATDTAWKGKMKISFEGSGVIDLDMISLFPGDTWQKRLGGMRADMVQMLADMKPGFIRFPGGCVVEGHELATRYQWKNTIGPIEERKLMVNRWNTEFPHRSTPDYFQTFGLGFFEYFQLAEDIGASPLPILNCGMACQFNTAEVAPVDQLDPYIQDALDLVEFANGGPSTKWGKIRTSMGHPAPFNLKMMGVGNENWGPQYVERLKIFSKAIKAKYPEIKIVNSSGTDPEGERFDYLNGELRKMNADIIDEHYYRSPSWFFANAKRYDNYPRNGSKIFGGEYAAHSIKTERPENRNNWGAAIAEAAFMTGLERNADVVSMASYAPLFAHVDGWQWTPDLIWVDNLRSYGTPNYYVQKLYALNKGTDAVPILLNDAVIAGTDSLYATAAVDKSTGDVIIKIVNASAKISEKQLSITGLKKLSNKGKLIALQSDRLDAVNAPGEDMQVAPKEMEIEVKNGGISLSLSPYSFNIIRVSPIEQRK